MPDLSGVLHDAYTSRLQRLHFFCRRSLAAGNDGTRMPHPAPWRCRDPGNEANHWLLDVLLNILGSLLFRVATDFTDHHDSLRFRIFLKQRQDIHKTRAVDGITANSYAGRFS